MIRNIAIAIVVLVGAGVALVLTRPSPFPITRTATLNAPVDVVFSMVNDFRAWDRWSPWEDMDPSQTKTHSGPEAGEGASVAWSGNADVGKGSMTITKSVPNERIEIDLRFIEPFQAKNEAILSSRERAKPRPRSLGR
ncbi:MAG: SRPBCC family protein [Myxococcales bacterium]|nr:SRPBCC family protein [Myxococcales bacterium]